MGFFDKFTRTLNYSWNPFKWDWSVGDMRSHRDTVMAGHALASDPGRAYAAALADDPDAGFMQAAGQMAKGGGLLAGGLVGAIADVPVLRQVFGLLEASYEDLSRRPSATYALMTGDAINRSDGLFDLNHFTDAQAWKDAYNTTTYVTPGQAFTYSWLANQHKLWDITGDGPIDLDELTEQERAEFFRRFPTLGIALQSDPGRFDPRDPDAQRVYHDNTFMKSVSGSMDAALILAADPTIIAAPAARSLYIAKVKNPLDAAAIQSGRLETYVDSRKYRELKDFIREEATREGGTSEAIARRVFANHYSGDLAASLLFDAAQMQRRYALLGGKVDLYDTTFRALYGDMRAWETLTREARHIADAVKSGETAIHRSNAAQLYGTGDAAIDRQVNALLETKTKAFLDGVLLRDGKWGVLGEGTGLLVDTKRVPVGAPRLTWTSAWRAGTHEFVRNIPMVKNGFWARRAQMVLPSQRSGRMLDLHDANSTAVFRSTFSRSRMSQDELNHWVSRYAGATSSEARFHVYLEAENAALRKHLERYGLTQKEFDAMVPVINRFRAGNRQILAHNRMFASAEVKRNAEEAFSRGREAQGRALEEMSDEVRKAVERGDMPEAVYRMPDESGVLTFIPEDTALRADRPLLRTQHADMVPVVDWNVLENALWWLTGGGSGGSLRKRMGRGAYAAQDATRAALDVANTVWKAAAILRPGYVWRTLSDEVLRMYGVIGARLGLLSMGQAPGHMAQNMRSRGRLLSEIMSSQRARRMAAGKSTLEFDAPVVAKGKSAETPASRAQESKPFEAQDLHGKTWDEAFADGTIGLDDLMDRVTAHGSAGTLPEGLATLYNSLDQGIPRRQVQKQLVNYVLTRHNRGTFVSPTWQQFWIEHVVARSRKPKPNEAPSPVAVDPFTGYTPEGLTAAKLRTDYQQARAVHVRPGEDGQFDIDAIYDYIFDHLDQLQRSDTLFGSYMLPDGRMALTTYRAVDAEAAIKPHSGMRVKLPFSGRKGELYRDSGTADILLHTAAGDVRFRGAFTGDEGDRFRKQSRSRGPRDSVIDALTDIEYARHKVKSGRWTNSDPSDWPKYRQDWERAVNAQLAGDPVARQFMQGRSLDEVMGWLWTAEGRKYQREMGDLWRARYAENVASIQIMVDTYLPIVPGREHQSRMLREKAARREATADEFAEILPTHHMPQVHGASLEGTLNRGPIADSFKKLMDKTWNVLSNIPHDKLVRWPFATQRYKIHLEELAQARGYHLAKNKQTFTEQDLRSLEKAARDRALRDVHTYMFFNNASWDFAKSARFFSPFGSALMDSLFKHGVALRTNPERYWQVYKLWTSPERNGLITDADGNQLMVEDGEEVWYRVHPETGEMARLDEHEPRGRYITFRLPSWMAPDSFGEGALPQVRLNKLIFQTALSLPSFGPLVAVPANEFTLNNPEFSEKEWWNRAVLPFGVSENSADAIVPANIRNHYRRFIKDDEEFAQGQVTALYAAAMADYSLGLRHDPPTFDEARQKAADLRHLRWLSAFLGVSPQFQSPYQPFVDHYRGLKIQEMELRQQAQAEGRDLGEIESADEQFIREMGDEYFALTASVTRNAMGIPATIGADKAYRKYQDLMERHPDIASLILGEEGAGEFNHAVYQAQKKTRMRPGSSEMMRGVVSPEDAWKDVQRRKGWIEYGKLMDAIHVKMNQLGITSLNDPRAEPLARVRAVFLASHTFTESPWGDRIIDPWFQDFRTVDTSRMMARLESMRQIAQDPRLQGRDDIRGLIQYLDMRSRMKAYMQARGFSSLKSQEAARLKAEWSRIVFLMKDENLSFAALYDRWLHADEDLEA